MRVFGWEWLLASIAPAVAIVEFGTDCCNGYRNSEFGCCPRVTSALFHSKFLITALLRLCT